MWNESQARDDAGEPVDGVERFQVAADVFARKVAASTGPEADMVKRMSALSGRQILTRRRE
jgi:hypothetical protein